MQRLFLAFLIGSAPVAAAAAEVTGRWLTQDRSAIVSIAPCGTAMCGTIAKVLVKKPGVPSVDARNPDPALRSRPIEGLTIITGMKPSGNRWQGGRIYDPRSGKSYRSNMQLNSDGSLRVAGCMAVICKAQRWTRAR